MQTIRGKKIDRLRGWLARNTKNLVMYRLRCGVCAGWRPVDRVVSSDRLQSFVRGPRTLERGDSATIQLCTCRQKHSTRRLEGKSISQIWYDDTSEFGPILPSLSDRAFVYATRLGDSRQLRHLPHIAGER